MMDYRQPAATDSVEVELRNSILAQNAEVALQMQDYQRRKAEAQLHRQEEQLAAEGEQHRQHQHLPPQAPPMAPGASQRRLTEGSLREQEREQERFARLEQSLARGAQEGQRGGTGAELPQRASKGRLTHPERTNSAHKENRGKISLLPPSTAASSCAPSRRGGAAPSESGMTTASERLRRPVHYSHLMSKEKGGQMDDFLNPAHGIREQMRRAGVEPKNHLNEQRRLLADMKAQKQQRAQQDATVAEQESYKREVLKHKILAEGAEKRAVSAGRRANKPPEPPPSAPRPHEPGHVPAYLRQRKAEWAAEAAEEEARRRAEEECPPGLRLVGDEERRRILDKLAEERAKTAVELQQMPFVIKTNASQQKKDRLEARLEEIEGAVEAYMKDKVFVPADM